MSALVNRMGAGLAVAIALGSLLVPASLHAWGDRTHRVLNRLAVETLHGEARDFFAAHRRTLGERAVEPDTVMRAREGREEKIRHYIDIDELAEPPFRGFPRFYRDAVRRFGRKRLEKAGVLPWVILRFQRQLREAIAGGDTDRAVREAAYLGHYVTDLHQPLHLTRNFDGQLSGARGIHKRLEDGLVDARLPEWKDDLRDCLRPAAPVDDLRDFIFARIPEIYEDLEPLFSAEREATHGARRGSSPYYDILARELRPQLLRELCAATQLLGNLWQTAVEKEARGLRERRRKPKASE